MLIQRLLLIVIVTALSACDAVGTLLQTAENALPHAETVTYRNERFNYEIDYPAGWAVEETNFGTELRSYDSNSVPPEYAESMPPGNAKITITPLGLADDSKSLADIIEADIQSEWPLGCVDDDPIIFTLARGESAFEIRTSSDLGGAGSVIYTNMDGQYFRFDVWGRLSRVQDIVRSLRPIILSNRSGQQDILKDIRIEEQYYCLY